MAKKFKLKPVHLVITVVVLFVLSQIGVMNELFAVTSIQCTSDAQCPDPDCLGGFTLAEKNLEDCTTLNNTADKTSCELSEWWYDAQDELAATRCVDPSVQEVDETGHTTGWHMPIAGTGASAGKCETSPYCVVSTADVKEWVRNNPLAWVRDNFALAIGLFIISIVLISLLYGQEGKKKGPIQNLAAKFGL